MKDREENKELLCEELAEDKDFKDYIPIGSIKMKIENYRYRDTGLGLSGYSAQSNRIFDEYKNKSIEEIEKTIEEIEKK